MKIPELIKDVREHDLCLSQRAFGKLFNMSGAAVSMWESNKREAPYSVIEYCLDVYLSRIAKKV